MRLIDADRLLAYMNDYALQECPNDDLPGGSRKVYEAIKDCMEMVEEAETVMVLSQVTILSKEERK